MTPEELREAARQALAAALTRAGIEELPATSIARVVQLVRAVEGVPGLGPEQPEPERRLDPQPGLVQSEQTAA